MRSLPIGLFLCAALAVGCGPASVRPVSYPDAEVGCPGGRVGWVLQIEDQRVKHEAEAKMTGSVRDAIQKSFPGCRWPATDPDEGTIAVEVHRFASHLDSGFWEAAVEWSVTARDSAGHTVTQFEVNEEVSRPNYQGSDNEKESLSEAFGKAVERTSKGLTAMPISGLFRHPAVTAEAIDASLALSPDGPPSPSVGRGSVDPGASHRPSVRLERISQPVRSEDL